MPLWVRIPLFFLAEIARLVQDYGIPPLAFGWGIYVLGLGVGAFPTGWATGVDPVLVSGLGLFLMLLGLVSWFWLYFREHPPTAWEEAPVNPLIARHLDRLMTMVEDCNKTAAGRSAGSGEPPNSAGSEGTAKPDGPFP